MRDMRSESEEYLVSSQISAMYDMLDNCIDADMLNMAPTTFRNVMICMSDSVDDMRKYPPSGTCDMTASERRDRIYNCLSNAYSLYVSGVSAYAVKNDFVSGNFDKLIDEFDDKFFFKDAPQPKTFVELCDARQLGVSLMSHRDSERASSLLIDGKYGCERSQVPSIVLDRQRDSNLQLNGECCRLIDRINDENIIERYKRDSERYYSDFGFDYEDCDNYDNDDDFEF